MIPTLDLAGSYKVGVGYDGAEGVQYNAWDPTHKGDHFTLTNQDRTAASAVGNGTVLSVYGKASGVFQCEHTIDTALGFINLGVAYQTVNLNDKLGVIEDMWTWNILGTKSQHIGSSVWASGTLTVNDVLGVVVDIGSNILKYYKNGTLLTFDPFGWPGGPFSNIMRSSKDDPQYGPFAGTVYWAFQAADNTSNAQVTSNFGHTAFAFPVAGASPMHGPTT